MSAFGSGKFEGLLFFNSFGKSALFCTVHFQESATATPNPVGLEVLDVAV